MNEVLDAPCMEEMRRHTFATTHWSVVKLAADTTSQAGPGALAELCQAYWHPLYVFIRHKGIDPHAAQDLTQAFLADFLARDQVARADRGLGRFRSFLVASLENFLHNEQRRHSAQKRGGGRQPVSMDALQPGDAGIPDLAATDNPAAAYDRQWARTLLNKVVDELQAVWDREGRGEICRDLLAHLWGDANSVPYSELCTRYDLTPVNLRVTYHRFRQQYRIFLRRAVGATVTCEEEVEDEIRFLIRAISQ